MDKNLTQSDIDAILSYWNTYEFMVPYNLSRELQEVNSEDKTDPLSIKKSPTLRGLKPGFFDFDHYDFTIFFGITNMSDVIGKMNLSNDDEFYFNYQDKITCVGKIEFMQECGVTRIELVGLSTLHWAITKYAEHRKMPLSSDFQKYRSFVINSFAKMVEHFRKVKPRDISHTELYGILFRLLMDEEVWYPDSKDYKILCTRRPKTKPYIEKVLVQTFGSHISPELRELISDKIKEHLAAPDNETLKLVCCPS